MSFFFDVNYKTLNLSLSNYEHPHLHAFDKYFAPIMLCFTTIVFICFVYVVITQSPKPMKRYSFLLVYQVCTTYVYDIIIFMIQPILLFPYIGIYSNGLWQYGQKGNSILFMLLFLNVIFNYHSIILQMIFRLASLHTPNKWFYKFTNLKFALIFTLPPIILVFGSICLGFGIDPPEGELFHETLIKDYTLLKEFFQRHNDAIGFHPSFSKTSKGIFILMAILALLTPFILMTFYYFYFRQLNYVKNNLTENNRSMHVMLLKALIAQSLVLFVLMLFPFEIACVTLVIPYQYGGFICSLCIVISMSHTLGDIMVQFYFIKPYKNWITRKLISSQQQDSVVTIENNQRI